MTALKDTLLYNPVSELFEIRAKLRHGEKLNTRIQDWIRAYARMGRDEIDGVPQVLKVPVHYPEGERVDSKKLKKAYPRIYEQARLLRPWHSVKHTSLVPHIGTLHAVPEFAEVPAPAPGAFFLSWNDIKDFTDRPSMEAVRDAKLMLRPIISTLRSNESDCVEAAEKAGAVYLEQGWNGTPWTFDDGYTYGMRQRRFDGEYALTLLNPMERRTVVEMVPARDDVRYRLLGNPEEYWRRSAYDAGETTELDDEL